MTEAGQHGVRLLLLTQYYYPEVGAAQTRLRETVAGLRQRGFEVTVVAAMPGYPLGIVPRPYAWWRPTRERIDGTMVARLPTVVLPGAGMSRRMTSHASFALASLATASIAARFDVALIESPPLFLALAARVLGSLGLPYVFHVADPWPDFPIAMGYLQSRLARRLAYGLEDFAYQGAAAITTVSPGLVDLIARKSSAEGRVALIPNGVDVARFAASGTQAEARRQFGWGDGFTVVYAGTVGLAQGIETLLHAATLVDRRVTIRIVGEGVEKPMLETRAREMGLRNVVFHPSVPRSDVPAILQASDAGLVILRKGPLYAESHPTKLLETMAAMRPVIAAADGLASRIVTESGGGYAAAAEDPAGLAHAIETCRIDPDREARGAAARAYVEHHYERGAILDRLADVLASASRAS